MGVQTESLLSLHVIALDNHRCVCSVKDLKQSWVGNIPSIVKFQ